MKTLKPLVLLAILALSQSVFAKSAALTVKDSLFLTLKVDGDSLRCYARKNFKDSMILAFDSGARVFGYSYTKIRISASKYHNLGAPVAGAICRKQGLSWVRDSAAVETQTNICYISQTYIFKLKKGDVLFLDTSAQLLFSCRIFKSNDTFIPNIQISEITAVHLSYDSFVKKKWDRPFHRFTESGFWAQNPDRSDIGSRVVFADAKYGTLANMGISFGDLNAQDINYGVCKNGIVCIVFDGKTGNLKVVDTSKIQPDCFWGRKWTTFGHFENYQIYYAFDLSVKSDSLNFIKFLTAIKPCDQLVMFSRPFLNRNKISNKMDSMMGKFGAQYFNNAKDSVGYVFIGRKGLSRGMGQEKMDKSNYVWVSNSLLKNEYGCATDAYKYSNSINAVYYVIAPVNSLHRYASSDNIRVFPNPLAGNEFYVDLKSMHGNCDIYISDISGKGIAHFKQTGGETCKIQLTDGLAKGIYFIRCKSGQTEKAGRFVVCE